MVVPALVENLRGGYRERAIARFWSKVEKNGPLPVDRPELGNCWLWQGATARGYGAFSIGYKTLRAHTVSLGLAGISVPEGLEPDHLCRRPLCVRPEHLEVVTHQVNTQRRSAVRTHCPKGHAYDVANTYMHRGKRHCRACREEIRLQRVQSGYFKAYGRQRRSAKGN